MSSANQPGIAWRTSSHSANGGGCVEVGWRTSSHSAGEGGCVEVARTPATVRVRDSKDRTGPVLSFPATAWRAFLATVTR
jgi:hypothetical protein